MEKIRIAVVGVGNCASSLIQGIHYYAGRDPAQAVGLMHGVIGGFGPSDVDVVAAFDIDRRKVGRDVSEAIFAKPNCTEVFHADVPKSGVQVRMGRILDGVSKHLSSYADADTFLPADAIEADRADVIRVLRDAGAEIVVNYLPVGSEAAARFYAECALAAGCGLVNCIPVFIASDPEWVRRFEEKQLPIVGDDIKAQLGATITHRMLTDLFRKRGVELERTYQLNTGGNTDFLTCWTAPASTRRRSRRPKPCSRWPQSGSLPRTSTSDRAITWPGRTTTRSASCEWRGGCSATCR